MRLSEAPTHVLHDEYGGDRSDFENRFDPVFRYDACSLRSESGFHPLTFHGSLQQ